MTAKRCPKANLGIIKDGTMKASLKCLCRDMSRQPLYMYNIATKNVVLSTLLLIALVVSVRERKIFVVLLLQYVARWTIIIAFLLQYKLFAAI